jgi:hypothetical protein
MKMSLATIRLATCLLVAPALGACVVHERTYDGAAAPPPPPAQPVAAPAAPPPPAPAAPLAPATPAAPPAPHPAPPPPAVAHPAYMHALSDLRYARASLERKGGDRQMKWDEHDGIAEIDRAIDDIKRASIDDGKNLEDHPPVDAREPRQGRLHKALAALQSARGDIAKEEDNAFAGGLRNRALHDVDEAIRHTEEGIRAAEQNI